MSGSCQRDETDLSENLLEGGDGTLLWTFSKDQQ